MWLKLIIAYLGFSLHLIIAGEVGDKCIPKDEIPNGSCRLVSDCEVAEREIMQTNHHTFRRCGFKRDEEIVCCPTTKIGYTSTPVTSDKYGDNDSKSMRIADRECQKIVDGSIPPLGLHIIGGEIANLGEFPHMAALGYEHTDGFSFLCGGSILSDRYILTAAHCVDTLDQIKPSIARMGVTEIGGPVFNESTDVRIATIETHPEYLRKTKYHDLALLKLEVPVQFSVYLNAICLYTRSRDPTIPLTVTGWGKTSTTKDGQSNILLKANVTVVSRNKCGESYTNWRKLPVGISEQQICAGDPKGLRDTCQGDSGGPLQGFTEQDSQFRLVGITSFGRGCGSPVPGVYTRVFQYLNWIESIVWPN